MGLRYYILVPHVRKCETDAGIALTGAYYGSVGSCQTCPEEVGCIVRNDLIRPGHSVEIGQHVRAVRFRSPALVRVRYCVNAVGSVASHTVDLLDVVPFRQLGVYGQRTVVFHAELVLFGFLRGDEDDAVAGAASVECRCGRAFQHGHVFDIVRVDAGNAVSEVEPSAGACAAEVRVVQRHSVDHIQRLVVPCHFSTASENDTCRAGRSACCLADYKTRYSSCHSIYEVRFLGFGKLFSLDFGHSVSECLAFSLDAESGHHYLFQHLVVFFEDDFRRDTSGSEFHGLVTYAYDFDRSP